MADTLSKVIDKSIDLLEKVSSPSSRAGSVINRVGKMSEEGVDAEVIALQMTKNSPRTQKYTESDINAYIKVYEDSKTKVSITAEQARGLIDDQKRQTQQQIVELSLQRVKA